MERSDTLTLGILDHFRHFRHLYNLGILGIYFLGIFVL
jgi:hypothetical protein